MVQILKGEVKKMYVDSLEINPSLKSALQKNIKETTIEKDALFYRNFIGREISFKYDTYLCTRMEAVSFLLDGTYDSVLFVDYDQLKKTSDVDKKELKQMKKRMKSK